MVYIIKYFLEPGISLTWDNVQMEAECKKQMLGKRNNMMLWANAFATKHRVSFRHLDADVSTLPASLMPLKCFLPSEDDHRLIKCIMKSIVGRIICKHLQHFQDYYGNYVTTHVRHQHWESSTQRSELVSIKL